jgi:eukaryotic-like serine/threonine-protein kinase
MELAEGEDLSQVLARGPLSVDDAIDYAKQIAIALDAAHEKGIVHRDLKPANVMVSDDGKLRVLDFGLAKAFETEEGNEDFSNSPTMVRAATHAGMILGTAAYMSPEQARGKMVDKRADIWAFGVVLWEMLTGKHLFGGETVSDTLAAVLKEEPDWKNLPDGVPSNVRHVLRRCLTKKPAERLRDIGDALAELNEPSVDATTTTGTAVETSGGTRRWLPWLVAAAALLALIATLTFRRAEEPRIPLRKLTVFVRTEAQEGAARLSPDGRYVAYRDREGILIRDLETASPRRVTRPGGKDWSPLVFWSPDSKWLAFAAEDKLWKVAVDGSEPTAICNLPPELDSICGAWGKDDRIVLGQWRGGLLEVSAKGGTVKELMAAPGDLVDYHALHFLPDGVTLLGRAHLESELSTIERIDGTTRTTVFRIEGDAIDGFGGYSPTGHLIVGREVELGVWAVPFSIETMAATGEPFVIAPGAGNPSVAQDGSITYAVNVDASPSQIVRVSMDGVVSTTIGPPGEAISGLLFSPDGRQLAYSAREKQSDEAWLLDLETGATRRLTLSTAKFANSPVSWSPDGRRLLISRRVPGNWGSPDNGLYLLDLDGTSELRQVNKGGIAGQFLPDGKTILVQQFSVRGDDNLALVTLDEDTEPVPLMESSHYTGQTAVSPDGKLVAFTSDESGTAEVWITTLPGAKGKRQVSMEGGRNPLWSRDGRTLFYGSKGVVYAVAVGPGDAPTFGVPKALFDRSRQKLSNFDILPDDSGFAMVQEQLPADQGLVYVQNWFAEFERK